jgi:hypothetical protein
MRYGNKKRIMCECEESLKKGRYEWVKGRNLAQERKGKRLTSDREIKEQPQKSECVSENRHIVVDGWVW